MTTEENTRRILIAMDGSDFAEGAFKWYVEKMRREEDHVVLLHVTDHRDSLSYGSAWMPVDPKLVALAYEEEEKKAVEVVQKLEALLTEAGIQGEVVRAHGEPGHAVIKKAEELHSTLIITGSRGLGQIRRTILGSVSDFIVHHSSVPVIICRH